VTRGWWPFLAALLLASFGAGCGDDPQPVLTSPTQTLTLIETFVGTLAVSGTSSKEFTVHQTGTVTVMLASLLASGNPVSITVRIGLGTWDATASTCTVAVTDQADAAPALTMIPNFGPTLTAGSRCVSITDFNNLGPVDFAIRVVHP